MKIANCVQKCYLMCLQVKVNYVYKRVHYVKIELIHLHTEDFISQTSFKTEVFLFNNYFKINYFNNNSCYCFLIFVIFKCLLS